ncbi:DUF930 domain-containing protein [Ensifer sesbaniae]|uniref:DUF930 domain-containing protein n=1 Tax=Ensifer sesbaniae TaxID=1214071 RepID=UPI0015689CD7
MEWPQCLAETAGASGSDLPGPRINADKSTFKPDKVIAAIFRSKGEWYKLKFRCRTDAEHLQRRAS